LEDPEPGCRHYQFQKNDGTRESTKRQLKMRESVPRTDPTDGELSKALGRAVQAIQQRRSHLLEKGSPQAGVP
jgi:hypothetical protein